MKQTIKRIILLNIAACITLLAMGQSKKLVVSQDGSGAFRTVQAAFDAIPENNKKPITVFVKNGVYKEKLLLDSTKRFVTLTGEDRFATVITYDDHAGKVSPQGDTINTRTSHSVLVAAPDFTARNITFQNNAGFSAGQAVAVQITGDRAAFFNCRFIGNQDVLFPSRSFTRQYFKNCYIEGTTDFIFGPSTAFFEQCHVHSKKASHITAASTPPAAAAGYVFYNCIFTADTAISRVSLGRPWGPYASVTYLHCYLGPHILPEGWNNWSRPANEETARYAEYQNFGPGAGTSRRVPWARQLTKKDAQYYSRKTLLGDWNPFLEL